MLVGVLVVSSLGLIPGQPRVAFGAEIFVVGVAVWAWPLAIQRRAAGAPDTRRSWIVTRALTHQIATLPLLVAGLSMLAGAGGGLYWLVPGTLLSFAAAILNSWVLLVEIQR
ncbi:MAG TPA: hypothetical protein VH853_02215 [Polyangia bacterium]|nr:hypothetical protein [Polyangia bacterium]